MPYDWDARKFIEPPNRTPQQVTDDMRTVSDRDPWESDSQYPMLDWVREVQGGGTAASYRDWVAQKKGEPTTVSLCRELPASMRAWEIVFYAP